MRLPYMQFFVGDWLADPQVSRLSPATRGIWFDALCLMHQQGSYSLSGKVDLLARLCRCSAAEMELALDEMSVTCNANVTPVKRESNSDVTLTCRRLQRLASKRDATRKRVAEHRCNAKVHAHARGFPTPTPSPGTEVPQSIAPASGEKPPEPKPPKQSLRLNVETWQWEGVTDTDIQLWQKAYPAVDLAGEMAKAMAWSRANGARGRKSNWHKFLNNWFAKAQDAASRNTRPQAGLPLDPNDPNRPRKYDSDPDPDAPPGGVQ